jgi:hypothetical protein
LATVIPDDVAGRNRAVRTLPFAAQYQIMASTPLNHRESLRDIEACLWAQRLIPQGRRLYAS